MSRYSRRAWLTHCTAGLAWSPTLWAGTQPPTSAGADRAGTEPAGTPCSAAEAVAAGSSGPVSGPQGGPPPGPAAGGESPGPGPGSKQTREISPRDAAELQHALFRAAGTGDTLRVASPRSLLLPLREDQVGTRSELSRHALLIPEGVRLDLNGSTLALEFQANGHGVRLSNDSAIRRGTIEIVASAGKGSQACWHSAVSVGAAYGDGGTPDRPGHFARVTHWEAADLTIRQPFAAAGIQLMSAAGWGALRRITIADSKLALLGIGMDWGSVGPVNSADEQLPHMRRLWDRGEIYTTHPHDVLVEDLRVGRLTRQQDGNDAGLRCSACHRITVRRVHVEEAAVAVALFGGDLGYEFALPDQRDQAHRGYDLAGIGIERATHFGIVLNGLADNVWRARERQLDKPRLDPTQPGLVEPRLREVRLRGAGGQSQGVYAVSVTRGSFDDVEIGGFETGIHPEDWVDGLTFERTHLRDNRHPLRIEGTRAPARGVVVRPG
ncbi:MAG: hypothetical protein ACKOJF_26260 [Planctomycetaceae bacterium]